MPVLVSTAPLLGPEGEIWGAVAVFDDISERKRAEEAIREREERSSLCLEFSGTGWDTGRDRRTLSSHRLRRARPTSAMSPAPELDVQISLSMVAAGGRAEVVRKPPDGSGRAVTGASNAGVRRVTGEVAGSGGGQARHGRRTDGSWRASCRTSPSASGGRAPVAGRTACVRRGVCRISIEAVLHPLSPSAPTETIPDVKMRGDDHHHRTRPRQPGGPDFRTISPMPKPPGAATRRSSRRAQSGLSAHHPHRDGRLTDVRTTLTLSRPRGRRAWRVRGRSGLAMYEGTRAAARYRGSCRRRFSTSRRKAAASSPSLPLGHEQAKVGGTSTTCSKPKRAVSPSDGDVSGHGLRQLHRHLVKDVSMPSLTSSAGRSYFGRRTGFWWTRSRRDRHGFVGFLDPDTGLSSTPRRSPAAVDPLQGPGEPAHVGKRPLGVLPTPAIGMSRWACPEQAKGSSLSRRPHRGATRR